MRTRNLRRLSASVMLALGTIALTIPLPAEAVATVAQWSPPTTINNIATFSSPPRQGYDPGTYGSEYPRMVSTAPNHWMIVYTKLTNSGYENTPAGGNTLQIDTSKDNARTWTPGSTITSPGRDLDNGHILRLTDGTLLLAARSVIWQQSYQLPVYKSTDNGATWTYLSTIDQNDGTPGSLGSPDKGMYEPYLYQLPDGRVSALYANEVHVTENPSYSQVISQRLSSDGGATWGAESYVAANDANAASRPGMPVATRLINGSYMVVFEVCGTNSCDVYSKTSPDGVTWTSGIGTAIPGQQGGPYVSSLKDGRLVATSNTGVVSVSNDLGNTWYANPVNPWPNDLWSSVYQTADGEIAALTSARRPEGGHNIKVRFGTLPQQLEAEDATVNGADIRTSSAASQNRFVGGIDSPSSYVEFSNVYVGQAGTYRLTVNYANGGASSTHNLSVNGTQVGTVDYAPTGSWGSFSNATSVDVSLRAGSNIVRLAKGTNYAEVDQIALDRYEAENAIVNGAIRYYGVGASPSGQAYVGGIDSSTSYVEFSSINAITAGVHTLRIHYANGGATSSHRLTVNGVDAGSVSYDPTNAWGHFASTTATLELRAGTNTLRLTNETNFAEVDYVEVFK